MRTRAAVEAGKLLRYRNSYQIVEGSVVRVKAAKSRTYLDFGRDWRTDFSAGIDTKVLHANPEWAKTLAELQGRRVEVRGWIEYRSGPYIAIDDPSQLTVIEDGAHPAPAAPGGARAQQRAAERAAETKTPGAEAAGRRSLKAAFRVRVRRPRSERLRPRPQPQPQGGVRARSWRAPR